MRGAVGYPLLTSSAAHLVGELRRRAAALAVHGADVRGRVDRHDGAHRAPGREQSGRPPDPRDPDGRRSLPDTGFQDLHLRRRPRPHGKRGQHDPGAHRGCAARGARHLPVRSAQAQSRGRTAGRQRRGDHPGHPQDRLEGHPESGAVLRRAGRLPRLAGGRPPPWTLLHVPDDERGQADDRRQRDRDGGSGLPGGPRLRARTRAGTHGPRQGPHARPGRHHRARRRAAYAAPPRRPSSRVPPRC